MKAWEVVLVDHVDVPSAVQTSGAVEQASPPVARKRVSENKYTEGRSWWGSSSESSCGFHEKKRTQEDVGEQTEPHQLVEEGGGEVAVSCKAGVEDVRNRGEEAPKDPAEEEAARRRAYEEAVTHAVQEEKARRNSYPQENSARRIMDHTAPAEKRGGQERAMYNRRERTAGIEKECVQK